MSIKAKLMSGYLIVITLLAVIGVLGWFGISSTAHHVEDISYQLSIAKDVNRALVDAGDAQAHALRLIIYKDEEYMDQMQKEVKAVKENADKSADKMQSEENKANASKINHSIEEYNQAAISWWKIEEAKQAAGSKRAAAAGDVLDLVKEIIDIEVNLAEEKASSNNGQMAVVYLHRVMLLQELRNATNRFLVSAQKYQIAVTPAEQDTRAKIWMKEIQDVDDLLIEAENEMKLPVIKEKIAEAQTAINNYRGEVMAFRKRNLEQRAEQKKQKETALASMNACRKVRDGVYAFVDKKEAASKKSAKIVIWIIVLGAVISVVIAVATALIIGKSIIGPIMNFVNFTGILKEGDLETVLEEGSDELGQMAVALNGLVVAMRSRAELAEEIANGNLQVDVDIISEKDILGKSFEKMVLNLNEIIGKVADTTRQVSNGAAQMNDASLSLSEGAVNSASSLEEITSSMTEMENKTKMNAENANESTKLAGLASRVAGDGKEKMALLSSAMLKINTNSEQTQNIIKTINDIAFQTNLLALNAAVEAARAGSHGKGFAVVAEEVRNLAARSAKAAQETADLIEKSGQEITEGVHLSEQTAHALDDITENITKTNELVSHISEASTNQSDGISEINLGLTQVDSVTQQNSANAEETASASTEMASMAETLINLVSRFKLKKR